MTLSRKTSICFYHQRWREGNLHRFAKETLYRELKVQLPDVETGTPVYVTFQSASLEVPIKSSLGNTRADCLLTTENGKQLAVEFKVRWDIDNDRTAIYQEQNLGTILIDLSHLPSKKSERDKLAKTGTLPTIDFIKKEICANHKNVSWLYNEKLSI